MVTVSGSRDEVIQALQAMGVTQIPQIDPNCIYVEVEVDTANNAVMGIKCSLG